MQTILKECMSPRVLQVKYRLKDIRATLTEYEISLMEKLPNMDEFTIELCYKILRYENLMLEPSCKWGNTPCITDVEIADDIQRIVIATNEVIGKKSEDVSETYYEGFQKRLHDILNRVDKFLHQVTCIKLYKTICKDEVHSTDILQELALLQRIDITHIVDETSLNRERISRISLAIIDSFPNIFRDIIRSIISPSQLYQMCIPHLNSFFTDQKTCLSDLQSSNSYDSFDISLIYKLLRQFSLVPSPTNGWGNAPNKIDTKLSDDIERIRHFRNQLAHRCSSNITEEEFDNYFDQFRDICKRMDLYFFQNTNYEYKIIGHKTCRIDTQMQTQYNNTLNELENLKLRFERHPIKFFWGNSFDRCLVNLRSMLMSEKSAGRQKVRVQIIFQNNADIERTIDILNSLKDEINENLSGIEFIVATKGSIVLHTDIYLEILETDALLQSTLTIFLRKILERITTSNTESIDMVLLPVEEYTQWKVSKPIGEPVYLDFDILAGFFETDGKMEEQLRQISDAFSKHSNGSGTNSDITATLLPLYLENKPTASAAFIQAQTPVKYNLPVYVTLRKQLNIKRSSNENHNITSCIKIGTALVMLVFTDCYNKRLIICNSDGTAIHHIPLSCRPYYITEVDNNTVAVSSTLDRTILIINISRSSVTNTINTSGYCYGISYDDNNLHVVIDISIIQVMDLTGKVIRTIPLPSGSIRDITVDRDRFVCRDFKSIYCCSLDGKLLWKFEKDKYQDLRRVTTDNERNVFVADRNYSVVVVSDDGEYYREILTKSDGLNRPGGIYFDKKENILLVCNLKDGKAFLFDVKKKLS
ncbi:uncharacterized protein LOC127710404 [Mytilus californianus]|uniref:uncharacterized protein LOC127710404 n=1 Tax=Mytilus californianus TaxID=6549 RepID=UPI00224615A6|nr:uncharacterized protein LOC127710404 [Mytilus californianus]